MTGCKAYTARQAESASRQIFGNNIDYSNSNTNRLIHKKIRSLLQRMRQVRSYQEADKKGELNDYLGGSIIKAYKERSGPEDLLQGPHYKFSFES